MQNQLSKYRLSHFKILDCTVLNKFFNLHHGVRQGCSLSVYLFLLVAELLANNIKANQDIAGIRLGGKELNISQMADDTTIFLKSEDSIPVLLNTLDSFSKCSGLKTMLKRRSCS